MNPTPTPLASTAMAAASQPKCTPDQLAASEWSRNNWTEGMRIAGADSNYVAFHAFVAGAQHFQPLLAKVEAQRDEACERFREATSLNAWTLEEFGKVRADLAAKEAALGLVLPYAQMLFEGRKPYGAGADVLPCIIADARSALASRADKGGAR